LAVFYLGTLLLGMEVGSVLLGPVRNAQNDACPSHPLYVAAIVQDVCICAVCSSAEQGKLFKDYSYEVTEEDYVNKGNRGLDPGTVIRVNKWWTFGKTVLTKYKWLCTLKREVNLKILTLLEEKPDEKEEFIQKKDLIHYLPIASVNTKGGTDLLCVELGDKMVRQDILLECEDFIPPFPLTTNARVTQLFTFESPTNVHPTQYKLNRPEEKEEKEDTKKEEDKNKSPPKEDKFIKVRERVVSLLKYFAKANPTK